MPSSDVHGPLRFRRSAISFCGLVALAASASVALATPPEFARAVAAAEKGDHAACSAELESVGYGATQHGLARRAFYGAAVCAAQGGELDRAFALLDRAIALDFHDKDRFYDDPRLQPLRTDRRWVGLEGRLVASYARWEASLNAELTELVRQDQGDRRPGVGELDFDYIAGRDRERCKRAREIVVAGGAKSPDDQLNAALVLQRSDQLGDLEIARQLALSAAEADADLSGARRLAATTLDRALVQSGKPQRYGTQSIRKEGRWSLAEVDPAVTDAERALWDVPPLAESRRRAEAMNGMPGATATPSPPPAAESKKPPGRA